MVTQSFHIFHAFSLISLHRCPTYTKTTLIFRPKATDTVFEPHERAASLPSVWVHPEFAASAYLPEEAEGNCVHVAEKASHVQVVCVRVNVLVIKKETQKRVLCWMSGWIFCYLNMSLYRSSLRGMEGGWWSEGSCVFSFGMCVQTGSTCPTNAWGGGAVCVFLQLIYHHSYLCLLLYNLNCTTS